MEDDDNARPALAVAILAQAPRDGLNHGCGRNGAVLDRRPAAARPKSNIMFKVTRIRCLLQSKSMIRTGDFP